jgi:hypothetical protein
MQKMFDVRRSSAMAITLFGLVVTLPIEAYAIDLTGAWATDHALCDRVFTKKKNQIAFSELSDLYGSGFIIDGSRIRGKSAQCTIKSRKEEGDTVQLSSACATTIMTSSVQFSLKVIDANTISRLFPEIQGVQVMALNYYRCAF